MGIYAPIEMLVLTFFPVYWLLSQWELLLIYLLSIAVLVDTVGGGRDDACLAGPLTVVCLCPPGHKPALRSEGSRRVKPSNPISHNGIPCRFRNWGESGPGPASLIP